MQVSHAQPSDNYAIVGGGKTRDFQIASSAHAFKILSDALYRDKEGAVVRETICNAKDAHIAVGKPNHPIKITLTDTEFTIEDEGTGIADSDMVEVYLTYFGSTKTNDDRQIGGFGLGCKAPFCLTDHFMVTSRHNHVQNTYALTAGNDETEGKPSIQLMATMPTTVSGLKVSIPIDRDKRSTFFMAIKRVLRDGGINATLNGVAMDKVRDYSGIAEAGFGLFPKDGYSDKIKVLYGSVLYPLDDHEQTREIIRDLKKLISGNDHELVLYAPPSSIAVTPSRESMGYNERTLETLNAISRRAIGQIKSRLPRARREMFIEVLQGTRRHDFANLANRSMRNLAPTIKGDRFIGAEAAVRVVARNMMIYDVNHVTESLFVKVAAKYYRDHAKQMLRAVKRSDHNTDRILKRDQYQYTLRKVMRAVMPVAPGVAGNGFAKQFKMGNLPRIHVNGVANHCLNDKSNIGSVGPKIAYVNAGNTRFISANRGLIDYLKYSPMHDTAMRLIIAPSRVAAECLSGFLFISKGYSNEQIAHIKANAERQHLKVTVIDAVPRAKPVKYKVIAEDAPTEMFAPFMFERYVSAAKGEHRNLYAAARASLKAPSSFIALAPTKRKLEVLHPKKPDRFIGPRQEFDKELKFHQCVYLSDVDEFTRTDIVDFENCALPLSIEERDRLVKLGVPRMAEKMLNDLKAKINRRSLPDAFTAYLAIGQVMDKHNKHHHPQVVFATSMASVSRRFACAVYLQPYKASPELDEVFNLWQTAHQLFKVKIGHNDWIDDIEREFFLNAKREFDALLGEYEKALPRDMIAFLKRMQFGRVTPADTEHLAFISSIAETSNVRRLEGDALERLAVLIEQEGKRFLADPKSVTPPLDATEEDDEDE